MLASLGEPVIRTWGRVRDLWQRSIQVRVITATLALSLIVVGLLATTMMRQITDRLLEEKAESAVAEASAGAGEMQRQLTASAASSLGELDTVLASIVSQLAASGQSGPDRLYDVVAIGTDGESRFGDRQLTDAVPEALQERVRADDRIYHTYTELRDQNGHTGPGLVVGTRVSAPSGGPENYGVYYLFPLTETESAIDVVQTAVVTSGVLLMLLLGALAWLVTRQVVTPVRMAARIAERFSAGELSERMTMRGQDDLARLARSFNQMATSLQHQIGQLEELSRVQQQFVSDVSHELRTPITTVRMAADVLYETKDDFDPAAQRSIELLQAQLDRFESLLTDLLEISRFDAGAAVLSAEPHDVRDLVHDVASAAGPLASRLGSEIVLDLPDDPCVAELDGRRIERVLRNLVVNAIEHGEGRDVRIRVAADEGTVAVSVRDYGVGLKPGESSLVFARFWRADPARARTTGGTGLGLSISLEDARLHGGWLQAWGEPGDGSLFRLTLPREAGGEVTASPLPLVPDDARPSWSKIGSPYAQVSGGRVDESAEVSGRG